MFVGLVVTSKYVLKVVFWVEFCKLLFSLSVFLAILYVQWFFPYLWSCRYCMECFFFLSCPFKEHEVVLLGLPSLIKYPCYTWRILFFRRPNERKRALILQLFLKQSLLRRTLLGRMFLILRWTYGFYIAWEGIL